MYQIDLHVHTAESSLCGRVSAMDMVKNYAEKGYQGIVITDHYSRYLFEALSGMSWADKMDQMLLGYRVAKTYAKRCSMDVYLGIEFRDMDNDNDYLIYGLTEEFLYDHEALYLTSIAKASRIFHEAGALICQAHPCRYEACTPAEPSLLDAVESFNGSAHWYYDEKRTAAFAKKNGLIALSGSDSHHTYEIGMGGVKLPQRPKDMAQLMQMLRANTFERIENPVNYHDVFNHHPQI